MTSVFYQGTLWGAWITPVEAISGQPQKERLAYKLVDITYQVKSELGENEFSDYTGSVQWPGAVDAILAGLVLSRPLRFPRKTRRSLDGRGRALSESPRTGSDTQYDHYETL